MNFDFWKMHGTGNDFVLTESTALDYDWPALAIRVCDRHFGVGADGLILYEPTPDGATMLLFNADGGRAEVSGNGLRGLAALLLRNEPAEAAHLTVDTEAGTKRLARVRVHLEARIVARGDVHRDAVALLKRDRRVPQVDLELRRHAGRHQLHVLRFAAIAEPRANRIIEHEIGRAHV